MIKTFCCENYCLIPVCCTAMGYRRLALRDHVISTFFKNPIIIHGQNRKEIIAMKESLYLIKHSHVDFHNIFSCKQSDKMGLKWIVFEAIRNTRSSCFIRYKTFGCASHFISDKTLMLVF